MPSPLELAELAHKRSSEQQPRILLYESFKAAYEGRKDSQGVYANYADGRPAMKDLADMRMRNTGRPAPNLLKPIIDDAVAVAGLVPTITFDPEDDSQESRDQAALASKVVRGMWEQSQMEVGQARAVLHNKKLGEVCYTLDPLRPADAKALGDPFALPGVYINVIDPSHAYPRFGTGREFGRIQDLFLIHQMTPENARELYPGSLNSLRSETAVYVITYYCRDYKSTILQQSAVAEEVYRDDHKYGFCPAEWAINKVTETHWGQSELDQAPELQRTNNLLFNLSIDSIIGSVFPVWHIHNPEHVGRVRLGPGAIVETVEDGTVEIMQPLGNTQAATSLLGMGQDNLLRQVGTSPIRVNGQIEHSNTSRAALGGAQEPMEQRMAISNVIMGNTLQWINSKVAYMLSHDKGFKNAQMSVYGTDAKGKRSKITFRGADLGDLWRNHVQWSNLLGGNEHEQLVMGLQLNKEGMYSKRKVLEIIGDPDPEATLSEAEADQQKQMQMQQGGQPQPPGGGGPTDMAHQGVALKAGALPQGAQEPAPPENGGAPATAGPAQPPPQLAPFAPLAQAPGGPPGGASPVPDIWSMVQQAITQTNPQLLDQIVNLVGTPTGIYVQVTDQRYIPILRTILNPVAKQIAGPDGQAVVSIKPPPTQRGS